MITFLSNPLITNLQFLKCEDYIEKCMGFSDSTATVEFVEDKIRYVCPISRIKNDKTVEPGDIRNVKWSDGKYYKAKILNTVLVRAYTLYLNVEECYNSY